jgi:hypothetical protein
MRSLLRGALIVVTGCASNGDGSGESSEDGSSDASVTSATSASTTSPSTTTETGTSASVTSEASSSGADSSSGGASSADSGSTTDGGELPDGLAASWITYLGGGQFEHARDLAHDGAGRVLVTGGGASTDLATTAGVLQPNRDPGPPAPGVDPFDAFVFAYDEAGGIAWGTYLGGPQYDRAYAVEVDATGVYVAGRAGAGFPVTAGAAQTSFAGGQEAPFYGEQDGFVCKLSLDASAIVWCTYFGTSDPSIVRDIAVDSTGAVYLASGRSTGSYPAAIDDAFVNAPLGGSDAVLAKLSSDGSTVLWARYLGGSADDSNQNSVRVDANDNPYILLTTTSGDAQTSPGAYDSSYGGNGDLYVFAAAPNDGGLRWATHLGASGNESTETHEFAVDAAGNCYVAAATSSMDFPTTVGAFDTSFNGGNNDAFAAKISADGTTLLGSTFIGGNGSDRPEGVAVGADGSVYFTGTTTSTDFPVTADAYQGALVVRDAVVVRVAPEFDSLLYASYLGGGMEEYGRGATVDDEGRLWIGGETHSDDLPLLDAAQTQAGGNTDAWVAGFVPAP